MREITWIAIAIFIYILYRYYKDWCIHWYKYLRLPEIEKLIILKTVKKKDLSFSQNTNLVLAHQNIPSEFQVLKINLAYAFKYSDEQIGKGIKNAIEKYNSYYVEIDNDIVDLSPYGPFRDKKIELEIDKKFKNNPIDSVYYSEYIMRSVQKYLIEYRSKEKLKISYYERYVIFDEIEKIIKMYNVSSIDANIRLAWLRCGMKNDFRQKMVRYWEFMEQNKQISESEYNAILDEMYDFI